MAKKQMLGIALKYLELYVKCLYEAAHSVIEKSDVDRLTRDIARLDLLFDLLTNSGHIKEIRKVTDKYPSFGTYLAAIRERIGFLKEEIYGP